MVRLAVILGQRDAVDEADSWYRQAAGAVLQTWAAWSNVSKPAWHQRSQPFRGTPLMDPGHGRGKRARTASMQVSLDVGPPNRRRS